MKVDETTLRLLTVLNSVSTKRSRDEFEKATSQQPTKLNKRKVVIETLPITDTSGRKDDDTYDFENSNDIPAVEIDDEDESVLDYSNDPFGVHFGADSKSLTEESRQAAESGKWEVSSHQSKKLGVLVENIPIGCFSAENGSKTIVVNKLASSSQKLLNVSSPHSSIQRELWDLISSYKDVFVTQTSLKDIRDMRATAALHTLNHVHKIRRRVLKNNDRIAHAPAQSSPEDIQDQGFTRPSILILLPFRSFAVRWLAALTSHLPGVQVENHARFLSEFSLPPGAVDKLLSAEPGTYPPDHVEMFQGNIDDDFRLGIKITRKSMKLFSEFYSSDIIIASPFGLRRVIDHDGNADFLSSIEILMIDQVDALTMQNWDHLLVVFSHLNQLPKESHNTDFSRVKPWYLDAQAKYARQSIIFSPYETPEMRSLFNSFTNVKGKIRTRHAWHPVAVPEGIKQSFTQFECSNPQSEIDKRFEYFTTVLFPSVMKSAVQNTNTVIFVPSYFDFIRVRHWLKQVPGVTLAVLFEESSNSDISRARQAFFSGKKAFLLTTERFHFFRRYRIRGIRNIIFYAPPDHPNFYSEYLSYPFLDEDVDASDINCKVLYSKWDGMRLERIVGSEKVKGLLGIH